MFKNILLIVIRHSLRHRIYFFLSLLCLSIGITTSLLIGIYSFHENSVNSDLKNINNQYIIKSNWKQESMGYDITTLAPLSKESREEYPEFIKNFYRFTSQNLVVEANDKHFMEEVVYCDTSLVSMFGLPLLYGNERSAFKNNISVIITENTALKYFGEKNVIGKTLQVISSENAQINKIFFVISAVLKDQKNNIITNFSDSKLPYQIFIPIEHNKTVYSNFNDWNWGGVPSFIELQPGVKVTDVNASLNRIVFNRAPNSVRDNIKVELAPLKTYHISTNNGAVAKIIYSLLAIAFFILLICIINYVNIRIGISNLRIKEIGLRKVFGSSTKKIVLQHLFESFFITFISIILSLILYELIRPMFSQLAETRIEHIWQLNMSGYLFILALLVMISLLAGIYPAFVLSSLKLRNAVRGNTNDVKNNILFKKIFISIQLIITIVILICSVNISLQISYVLNKDLGYSKNNLLIISPLPKNIDTVSAFSKLETFRDGLKNISGIQNASLSYEILNGSYMDNLNLIPEGSNENKFVSMPYLVTDEHYYETFGLRIVEGVFLNRRKTGTDPDEIVLNESAVKAFGWTKAIGKKVKMKMTGIWLTVVGVVKDFNFYSLHKKIEPIAFLNINTIQRWYSLSIKIDAKNMSTTVASIHKKWNSFFPGEYFEYSYMDDNIQALYGAENKLRTATRFASIIIVIMVFLGIYGIVSGEIIRRKREIAIRKVLGAGSKRINWLFLKDYLVLNAFANIVGWPIIYILTNNWLNNYVYRINQSLLVYLLISAFIVFLIIILISTQCWILTGKTLTKNIRE